MTLVPSRPAVVFDCNVIVQAIHNEDGPSGHALSLLEVGRIDVFLSRAMLRELRKVLDYPYVREKLPGLTNQRIEFYIQRLVFRATLLRRIRHLVDYPRARQDEPYLDAAWTAQADYLVSQDADLLDLATDFSSVAAVLRRSCPKLKFVDPITFLKRMSSR
jgi:putative PIN family toxin of toxin-antitoxin system